MDATKFVTIRDFFNFVYCCWIHTFLLFFDNFQRDHYFLFLRVWIKFHWYFWIIYWIISLWRKRFWIRFGNLFLPPTDFTLSFLVALEFRHSPLSQRTACSASITIWPLSYLAWSTSNVRHVHRFLKTRNLFTLADTATPVFDAPARLPPRRRRCKTLRSSAALWTTAIFVVNPTLCLQE